MLIAVIIIGANAAVLCYDITDPQSFDEMGRWLRELKQNLGDEIILHVVGTKSDMVAEHPSKREVPFERCIAYVAENLFPEAHQNYKDDQAALASPNSNRSSGFWGQDVGWDCCHEISAKDGEGVEEVFRVITRKLVEQRNRQMEEELRQLSGMTPGMNQDPNGYFDYPGAGNGSFRIGMGDKRRSWLGFPTTPAIGSTSNDGQEWQEDMDRLRSKRGGKCC